MEVASKLPQLFPGERSPTVEQPITDASGFEENDGQSHGTESAAKKEHGSHSKRNLGHQHQVAGSASESTIVAETCNTTQFQTPAINVPVVPNGPPPAHWTAVPRRPLYDDNTGGVSKPSPKSQRRFRNSVCAFPQPPRSFQVTHTGRGLYAQKPQNSLSLTDEQLQAWEGVATPRRDLDITLQSAAWKAESEMSKKRKLDGMVKQLDMSREQHQVHLKCLVNEAGRFQRSVLRTKQEKLAAHRHLQESGNAKLQLYGVPMDRGTKAGKSVFMLPTQPKLWAFLLADISALLADPALLPPDEEAATPKFVADQIYGLNLFLEACFENEAPSPPTSS